MFETQQSITEWATKTFGPIKDTFTAMNRMEKEIDELLAIDQDGKDAFDQISNECADVVITMYCVAAAYGFDLHACIDHKMHINRGRKWTLNGDGTGRHI